MRIAFCAVKEVLGIPCPGCGITTSVAALLRGHFVRAVEANAAGPLVVAFFVAQTSLAAAARARLLPDRTVLSCSRLNDRALIVFLLLSWLTRLR